MKQFIIPSYTFTPGASGVGTVNLSGILGFNIKYLAAIINQTRGVVIYATGDATRGYTNLVGTTLTLFFDTSSHNSGDTLQVMYELTNLNPLTDAQLRAAAVPISGTVAVSGTVPVSGTVTANTGLSQPVTDAQLRATPVPVSGTVTANTGLSQPLTDAQLRATAVPVSGTFFQATQPVSAASLPLPTGAATSANQATGNTSLSNIDTKTPALVAGRVPVDGSGVTQPVSGTFWQATQPVSIASSVAVTGPLTNAELRSVPVEIDAASLPLPTGAATETTLSTLNGKLGSLGQKVMASSAPVVIASDQSAIPITGSITASNPSVSATGAAVPAQGTMVGGTDGTNLRALKTDASGELQVDVLSSALPSGASTETTLSALNTKVPSGLTVSASRLLIDGAGVTQPVSGSVSVSNFPATQNVAVTSALPAGTNNIGDVDVVSLPVSFNAGNSDATTQRVVIATNQAAIPVSGSFSITGGATETTLSALNAKVPANLTVTATRLLVDGSGVTQPVSVASLPLPTGAATESTLSALSAKLGSLGQKTMAGSAPVVIASDQGTLPVSAASLPLPSGAATETTLSAVSGKLPTTLGQKTSANSLAVSIASDQSAIPASQSGTWNINNISGTVSLPTGAATSALQTTGNTSLSSIDTKTPALGQAAMAASSPVVIASNQSAIPITGSITATNPSVSTAGAALPASATSIGGSDGTNLVPIAVDSSGVVQVAVGSLALPTNAATESEQITQSASLASIDGKLPAMIDTVPANDVQAPPVRQVGQDIWNASFSDVGTVISPQFNSVTLAGMTFSQGSGNLAIVTGTGVRNEFLTRSLKSWKGSLRMRGSCVLSQRIANQNFHFIMADLFGSNLSVTVNSATSITVTKVNHGLTASNVGQFMFIGGISGVAGVQGRYAIASIVDDDNINFTVAGWPASGSGTATFFGHSHTKILFTGTTATQAAFTTQRNGWADADTTATINTTASPGTILSMELQSRECYLYDQLRASTTTPTVACRASRLENIPDDNLELYLWIWAYNGTVAPASSTTWTISFVSVEKFANQPVYIQGARANGAVNPLAVTQVGTTTVSFTQPALVAGSAAIGDVGIQYRTSTTGAASANHLVSGASTNSTIVKSSAGRLLGWSLANTNAAWRYVKFHNQATNPTAGTGVVRVAAVPPNGVSNVMLEGGIAFSTGIGITTVTGANDADSNAVGAADLVGEIFFA